MFSRSCWSGRLLLLRHYVKSTRLWKSTSLRWLRFKVLHRIICQIFTYHMGQLGDKTAKGLPMDVEVSTISLDQCSIIHIRTYSSSWRNWSAHRSEAIWKSVLQTRWSHYRNVRSALISYLNWEDSMRQTEFQDRHSYTE